MEPEQHLHALDDAGAAYAELAGGAAAGVPVPTCPGWNVEDVTRHLGKVHRWAATVVATPHRRPLPFEPFPAPAPNTAGELVPWFRDGHAALVRTLRDAPPDLDCWSFLPAPTPRAFWCRRQAHEMVIHLVDLALALGMHADRAPAPFAADGIDELLWGWMRGRRAEREEDEGRSLRIVATDHDLDWRLSFPGPRGVTLTPGDRAGPAPACTVRARAVDLYLLLWNRRSADGLAVEGDVTVIDRWASGRQVH